MADYSLRPATVKDYTFVPWDARRYGKIVGHPSASLESTHR